MHCVSDNCYTKIFFLYFNKKDVHREKKTTQGSSVCTEGSLTRATGSFYFGAA